MVESRVATLQGDNIGRLTRVTVVCRPILGFVNGLRMRQVFLPLTLGTVR